MELTPVLEAGFGFWNPPVRPGVSATALVIACPTRVFGEIGYRRGTGQTAPITPGIFGGEEGAGPPAAGLRSGAAPGAAACVWVYVLWGLRGLKF